MKKEQRYNQEKKHQVKRIAFFIVSIFAFSSQILAEDNVVEIVYNGTTATITVADNINNYVTISSGTSSHVVLTQTNTADIDNEEIIYRLSGTSTDGEFNMSSGSYKCTVELNNVTLTNASGAAISIYNGKRIKVKALSGTTNTLTDCASGSQKGCLYVKGHLELRGYGTLNVIGNTKHAIKSGEYMSVANITVNVTSAVGDGMNCNEYFLMESGTVSINEVQDDGIQCDLDGTTSTGETTDHEDEDSGNIYQTGGTLNIALASSSEGSMLKADGTVSQTGGTYNGKENTTAIESISAETNNGTTAIYDLNGRQIPVNSTLTKGIYIIKKNGKTYKTTIK